MWKICPQGTFQDTGGLIFTRGYFIQVNLECAPWLIHVTTNFKTSVLDLFGAFREWWSYSQCSLAALKCEQNLHLFFSNLGHLKRMMQSVIRTSLSNMMKKVQGRILHNIPKTCWRLQIALNTWNSSSKYTYHIPRG